MKCIVADADTADAVDGGKSFIKSPRKHCGKQKKCIQYSYRVKCSGSYFFCLDGGYDLQKGIIKALVLISIFLISVIGFGFATNQVNEDLTIEMAEATLPIITLYDKDMTINELRGYTREMDAASMRDSITPVKAGEVLYADISTYKTPVDAISYEIRSLDATRLIANADVTSYEEKQGAISVGFEIQNLLEANEEYLLVIELESGSESIYYYTRIMEAEDCNVEECLDFVMNFHETTFKDEELETLSTYLERGNGDNSTLHYTTLNNSLKQIGWADFDGAKLTNPVPSIKEITTTYSVIVLEYVLTRVGEDGASEYYNVEEYYRVRYTASRMYLLNFERTVDQIFRAVDANFAANYIQLGITSEEKEFETNESGKMVAFVQEGELWSYNQIDNSLAKVFSFRGYEGIDSRENYGEHGIKIVGVDEAGSIDYIVYGYMNRGIHEGEVGIAIYRYDSLANTNEEFVFIPSTQSYELMKSELGQLMYVSEGGMFYIMVDGTIYGIDLHTLETKKMVSDLTDECFAASESNRYFTWVESDDIDCSSEINVIDFMTEKTWTIEAKSDSYLRPLGFMKEDFVYGVAKKEDVFVDAAGNTTFPMYQVKIADITEEATEELKSYEKEGYYVESILIDDFTIYLNRIQHNGTAYVDAIQDMIMNREGDSLKVVDIYTASSDVKKREVQIGLSTEVSEKSPKILTPKETVLENQREVVLETKNNAERFYVYAKGDVILTTDNVSEAVIAANEQMGVVVGENQQYVWKRSRKTTQKAFTDITVGEEDKNMGTIAQCINAMLEKEGINISVSALLEQGETPKNILGDTMKDVLVLDLTGCTMDEVLYYISNGAPVFAMTGSENAVLLIGYDSTHVTIFDPALGSSYRKSIEEADQMFEEAGSIFFSYIQ